MTTRDEAYLADHAYRVTPRAEFDVEEGLPDGLRERAKAFRGSWVVWDPWDDADGLLLIGDDRAALIKEAAATVDGGAWPPVL